MNKRKHAIQATLAKRHNTKSLFTPSMPSGDIDHISEAKIDSELNYLKLTDSLSKAGISFANFLKEKSGILLSKPIRTITTPSGEIYTVATSHLTYKQLKELCVIDNDNVRDESELTENALVDIIDEIGMGFQLMPIIAYIDANHKKSVMEGSRRMTAALIRKVGLDVDIFDRKPSEETIRWVVETSNKKKGFSYFEKGKLYSKLMETHAWTQADLKRERRYTQQDISLSLSFFSAPAQLLRLLPSKAVPQSYVLKFNTATKRILEKEVFDEALHELKEQILGLEVLPIDIQAKKIVDIWHERAQKINKRTKSSDPIFKYGESKVFIKRTRKGSNISLQHIPKALEQDMLSAIENVFTSPKNGFNIYKC
ncbi:hypothetical protein CF67_29001 (plasmid) [Candidatus Photodesmus blepharus]|uniref:Uncharacterized protein n=1 Tax=Candidatus Photodesmus blepharonis TaxID=1179155 RepID=A0A084CMC5_9GAMM|nr:hypothetical protein [Candidatus Photodesmus blepharus]KEY90954.1 hypothetical protein CF67_29001 [Candidatus Photodesmus blepharus]